MTGLSLLYFFVLIHNNQRFKIYVKSYSNETHYFRACPYHYKDPSPNCTKIQIAFISGKIWKKISSGGDLPQPTSWTSLQPGLYRPPALSHRVDTGKTLLERERRLRLGTTQESPWWSFSPPYPLERHGEEAGKGEGGWGSWTSL